MTGFVTLLNKEMVRFWRVWFQTVMAPIITALLYLMVFSHALARHVEVYPGVGYVEFLVPGLVMMSLLQNAFANSSSSLIQSKITGNIVFVLLPPISYLQFFSAYLFASVFRGLVVGLGVLLGTLFFAPVHMEHPLVSLAFALLGGGMLGALGIIAGIWSEKFDQLAAFQNFIIMPLTFLSGVFYSIHTLPPLWLLASRFNPVFYMIDGFRYGFFGFSDASPVTSMLVVLGCFVALSLLCLALLQRGYKLRD